MIHKKIFQISVLLWTVVLLLASGIWAQDAKFRGMVKDEEGNPIANAKLTLTLVAHNLSFSFETNKKGKFYRRGIEPGEYLLTVEVEDYQPLKQKIFINVGQEYTMDIVVAKEVSVSEAKSKFEQGVLLFQQGKFDKAIEAFEAVLKEKPNFAEGFYNLGMVYLRKGDLDKAIEKMEKAMALNPDFIEAYFGMGQAYIEKGDEKKALKIYQKALSISPDDARVYVNLGALYFSSNQDDKALEAFLRAKQLDPDLPNIYYQLGLLYLRKEDIEKSIDNFQRFLELAPNAAEAETVRSIIEDLKKRIDY